MDILMELTDAIKRGERRVIAVTGALGVGRGNGGKPSPLPTKIGPGDVLR
jgi:hypothetical protein